MVTNRRTAVAAIAAREDFSNAGKTFSGKNHTNHTAAYFGQLPSNFWPALDAALDAGTYVIYSYRTPIAWTTADGWVMPAVKYSATTSQHQGIVRRSVEVKEIS